VGGKVVVIQHGDDVRELILTASWYIWWMCRQLFHGEKVSTTSSVAMSIKKVPTNIIRVLRKNPMKKKST
jgi:hypothetical protein